MAYLKVRTCSDRDTPCKYLLSQRTDALTLGLGRNGKLLVQFGCNPELDPPRILAPRLNPLLLADIKKNRQ